jgi:hypothetical protein
MSRLPRPLNKAAVHQADEQLYDRHRDDPRPNALFSADGVRRPLYPANPAQADLRTEWRGLYVDAATETGSEAGSHGLVNSKRAVSSIVQACEASPWTSGGNKKIARPDGKRPEPRPQDTHWIKITLRAQPDVGRRPDYWPERNDNSYASEAFSATLTSGPDAGSLDSEGNVRRDDIPSGSCRFHFDDFHREIERFFDQELS